MDWLTFVVEMSKAWAWPIAAWGVAVLFRKQLVELFRTLKKGKIGAAEFEFEREVLAIEAIADFPQEQPALLPVSGAASNPRGTILEAWLQLEEKIIELAMRRGLTNATARRYPQGAIRALQASGLMPAQDISILNSLRELRAQAAHDPDFAPEASAVMAYTTLAANMVRELEALMPQPQAS